MQCRWIFLAAPLLVAACGAAEGTGSSTSNLDEAADAGATDAGGALPVSALLDQALAHAAAIAPTVDSATVYQIDDAAPVVLDHQAVALQGMSLNGEPVAPGDTGFLSLKTDAVGFTLHMTALPLPLKVGSYACSTQLGEVTATTASGTTYTNAATANAPLLDCTFSFTALGRETTTEDTIFMTPRYVNVGTLEAQVRDATGGVHTLRVGFVDYGYPVQ